MDNTSSEDVVEAEPLENNNVNFEQEMAFYESNKEMLLNKMVDLENELAEEENLKAVLDKKESLNTLFNLGVTTFGIKRIFFLQGSLMTVLGGLLGLGLGFLIVWLQQLFDLVMLTR